jgi:hypothetical protein
MIKIEKNIPIPKPRNGVKALFTSQYPLVHMQAGDSFLLATNGSKPRGHMGALYAIAKRHSIGITARKVRGGVRIWRTK